MDAAGVLFARCEYDRCHELLDQIPANADFRADLYRLWMLELRGDRRGALAHTAGARGGPGGRGGSGVRRGRASGPRRVGGGANSPKAPGLYFSGYQNSPGGRLRQIRIEAESMARSIEQ